MRRSAKRPEPCKFAIDHVFDCRDGFMVLDGWALDSRASPFELHIENASRTFSAALRDRTERFPRHDLKAVFGGTFSSYNKAGFLSIVPICHRELGASGGVSLWKGGPFAPSFRKLPVVEKEIGWLIRRAAELSASAHLDDPVYNFFAEALRQSSPASAVQITSVDHVTQSTATTGDIAIVVPALKLSRDLQIILSQFEGLQNLHVICVGPRGASDFAATRLVLAIVAQRLGLHLTLLQTDLECGVAMSTVLAARFTEARTVLTLPLECLQVDQKYLHFVCNSGLDERLLLGTDSGSPNAAQLLLGPCAAFRQVNPDMLSSDHGLLGMRPLIEELKVAGLRCEIDPVLNSMVCSSQQFVGAALLKITGDAG